MADTKRKRRLAVLIDEYESRFGKLPPVYVMDDPIAQIEQALQTGYEFNPMPGDPGIPSDADL